MELTNFSGARLFCRVAPAQLDLFHKLLEGYDHLAYITTVDPALGRLALYYSPQAEKDLLAVLRHLPLPLAIEPAEDIADADIKKHDR